MMRSTISARAAGTPLAVAACAAEGNGTLRAQRSGFPRRFDIEAQNWSRREMLMVTPIVSAVTVLLAPVTSGDENRSRTSEEKLKLLVSNACATRRNSGSVSLQGEELAKKQSFCVIATAKRLTGWAESAMSATCPRSGPKSYMLAPVVFTVPK